MRSKETLNWVDLQNELTDSIVLLTNKEHNVAFKIKDYDHLSTNPLPTKKGSYFYMQYRKDKSLPAALFYRKSLNDDAIEIANPYEITKNKNAYLTGYYPSLNNDYLAYKLTTDGSDRQEIRFKQFHKNKNLEDVITNVKFSNVVWNKSLGVFYKKNSNLLTFEKDSTNQLYYHRLNTPQSDDKLIFDTTESENDFRFFTTKDTLFVIENIKENGSKSYYYSPLSEEKFNLIKFIDNDVSNFDFIAYRKGKIYFSSDKYEWGEVRSFSISNRNEEKVIIPQIYNNLLLETRFLGDYIICKYKSAGNYILRIYNQEGVFVRKFDVPHHMAVEIEFYDSENKDLFVTFSSFVISYRNFKLNLETGKSQEYYNEYIRPKVTLFPLDYFVTTYTTFKSRDKKDIPITIVHKKGIKLDGSNPTLLKAYGGFRVVNTPHYDTGLLYFLEKGGVFAYAEIRGGGEKGRKWHDDGKGQKKINTFNDFIDAAEFLIKEQYTSNSKLAITGGSQGGLLVGVAMTQRPDLFKVAVPIVGIYDMTMFGKYTAGKYWFDEYGNPDRKDDFEKMLEYSPYHNIKDDINYPITLIITSENDDRVVASHSYKFAAKLQSRTSQKNPIYLKVEKDAGHSGKVSNYVDRVEKKANFYSFLLYHLK
jgi:prolyl oligopeptidase